MHPTRRLIVTVMAEPYHKTEPVRLISQRTAEYVVPFEPPMRATYKAMMGVILYYASFHSDFNLAISSGVSVGMPTCLQSWIIKSRSLDICEESYILLP